MYIGTWCNRQVDQLTSYSEENLLHSIAIMSILVKITWSLSTNSTDAWSILVPDKFKLGFTLGLLISARLWF